jgi:putative ABC transport system permease protein
LNVLSLPRRLGNSSIIVIGMAGVVGVLLSILAMAAGLDKSIAKTGRMDRAIVLRGGATTETASSLSREDVAKILDAAGVARSTQGKAVGSAEVVEIVRTKPREDFGKVDLTLRGVMQVDSLRPEFRIVSGRAFTPGLRELVVGQGISTRFNLAQGGHLSFRGNDWEIVGTFSSGGDSHESEIWGDAETILSAFHRNAFHSVTVRLTDADAFRAFKDQLTADPSLSVDAEREALFYSRQSEKLSMALYAIGYIVGGIMALGAVFSALNTMHTSVSTRISEIATLRALGFGPVAVVLSVLAEALLLTILGAAVGATGAWLVFDGDTSSTLLGGYTQVVFQLRVTLHLILMAFAGVIVIGLIGGFVPAMRAARLPVAVALRQS